MQYIIKNNSILTEERQQVSETNNNCKNVTDITKYFLVD